MTEPVGVESLSAEAEAVLTVLERNRRSFAWKTGGLDRRAGGDDGGVLDDARRAGQAHGIGGGGLAGGRSRPDGTERTASVREMLLDMIEEYARHTGHADLLRESVDGLVGESAPREFHL